jgi:hypothetical protein
MYTGYWCECQKKRGHYKDEDVGGWKIVIWSLDRDGMDWINLAQDRDHWRILVNTVMNLQVP